MNKLFKLLLLLWGVLATSSATAQQIKLSTDVGQALTVVDTVQFKADIAYLADDRLLGRMPGTHGYQMAVDYVVGQLKSLNVEPAGENNTWLQEVKLRKAFVHNAVISFDYGEESNIAIRGSKDYAIYPNPAIPQIKISAGLVF